MRRLVLSPGGPAVFRGLAIVVTVASGCPFEQNTPVAGTEPTSGMGTSTDSTPMDDETDVDTTADTTADTTTGLDSTTGPEGDESTSTGEMLTTDTDDTGPPPEDFFDEFDRPPSAILGNGWVEKAPGAFQIANAEVVSETGNDSNYYDNLFYRGMGFAAADIEIAVEFRILVENNNNEPHILARVQEGSFTPGIGYSAYALVPRPGVMPPDLCIMRFESQGFPTAQRCTEWTDPDPLLAAGGVYRLTLRTTAEQPVNMIGTLEREVAGSGFVEILAVEWQDDSATRITAPGTWGISGGTGGIQLPNYAFDNARATMVVGG